MSTADQNRHLFVPSPLLKLVQTGILTIVLSACSDGQSAEEHYQKAVEHLQGGNQQAAMIELKNAIQMAPDHGAARQALGELNFNRGNLLAAQKEYQRSLAAGAPPNDIIPKLAEIDAMLGLSAEIKQLIARKELTDNTASANTLALAAISAFATGERESAQQYLAQAERLAEANNFVILAKAFGLVQTQQLDEAKVVIQRLPEGFTPPLAMALRGQLQSITGELEAGIATYRTLTGQYPGHPQYKLVLAQLLAANKQYPEAETLIDALLKLNKFHGVANQIKASLRFRDGDYPAAQEYAELALASDTDNADARVIAGMAAYKQAKFERALQQLRPLADTLEPDSPAVRALIALKLRLGDTEHLTNAMDSLDPQRQEDMLLIAQATGALVRKGKLDDALRLAGQAQQESPENHATALLRGQVELIAGKREGLDRLKNLLKEEPGAGSARVSIAHTLVREGKYQQALALSKDWLALNPNQPQGHLLAGLIYSSQDNLDAARSSFQAALDLAPDNLSAAIGLADVLIRQGALKDAVTPLLHALDVDPTSPPTLSQLVQLAALNRPQPAFDPELILTRIQTARASQEKSPILLAAEATLLILNGDRPRARTLLEAQPLAARTAGLTLLLGDLYLAEGNTSKAQQTYDEGLRRFPDATHIRLRTIGLLEHAGQGRQALRIAIQGLNQKPDDPDLALAAANLHYRNKQLNEARELLQIVPVDILKTRPFYWKLKGILAMAGGKYPEGIAALTTYHAQTDQPQSAIILATSYQTAGQPQKAVDLLEQQPFNLPIKLQLASLYNEMHATAKAQQTYLDILDKDPENTISLNNLSLLHLSSNDLPNALKLAARAYQNAPEHPAILETYGRVLMAAGNQDNALIHLKKAYELVPDNRAIASSYASALQRTGADSKAKEVMSRLQAQ